MDNEKDARRTKLTNFLHTFGHYDKKRLCRKALELKLYQSNESNEDIYNSLMRFKDYHNIKIIPPIEKVVEEVDEKLVQKRVVELNGTIKVHQGNGRLVQAIKEEMANLEQTKKMLENLLSIYENKEK
tara:strand:+ start:6574 stop:6957 length:384 start_codon:yes stop_codon:yes gene_type:complete